MVRECGQDGPAEWTFRNRPVPADLHDFPRLSNIKVPESIWRAFWDDILVFPLLYHARLSILHEIGGSFIHFSRSHEKKGWGRGLWQRAGAPAPCSPWPLGRGAQDSPGSGALCRAPSLLLALWRFIRVLRGRHGVPGGQGPKWTPPHSYVLLPGLGAQSHIIDSERFQAIAFVGPSDLSLGRMDGRNHFHP